jgi:hypothetical protein
MKIDTLASLPPLGITRSYLSLILHPHSTTCTEDILRKPSYLYLALRRLDQLFLFECVLGDRQAQGAHKMGVVVPSRRPKKSIRRADVTQQLSGLHVLQVIPSTTGQVTSRRLSDRYLQQDRITTSPPCVDCESFVIVA